jgi:hypothetical protein
MGRRRIGRAIKRLVRDGHLHRIHRGVYAVGHPRITDDGRRLAAVLACGPGAVLSHGPAGQVHGIVNARKRLVPHVTMIGRRCSNPGGIVTHRPRSLAPSDTTRRRGIPVTTGTRTVWDLASVLTPLRTRRAFEGAEKLGLLDRGRLQSLLAASPNHKGGGTLRALLGERQLPLAETRSWLEELAVTICRDHSLPMPAVNVPVLGWEVDLLWEPARFIVEADGADHLSPRQRDTDKRPGRSPRKGGLLRPSLLSGGDEPERGGRGRNLRHSRRATAGAARQPIATIRSIGILASSAIRGDTLTSPVMSRRQSRSFGSVIIFM